METIPYLDLQAQYAALRSEVLSALEEICESTTFAQGPATSKFEAEFAAYCGVDHCVSLNSGTSALHLALRCLDVGPGDEVVTVSMTFIATAWAISYVGATPVFVDIDPVRRTLNVDNLEAAITSRTKAIIPVHLYGMPAEMDRIMAIAEQHGVPVIEDAAQAHGARYQGRRVGQFGQIACFSFYPSKNLGAYGEGGALITNDASIAHRARSLRDHAQSQKYLHDEIGYNYRMDSFQGAVLSIKLKHLDEWNTARIDCARQYTELLKDSSYKLPAHMSAAFRWEMETKSGQPLSPCVEINGRMLADVSGEEVERYLVENKLVEASDAATDVPTNAPCANEQHEGVVKLNL